MLNDDELEVRVFGLSPEYKRFMKTARCPRCDQRVWWVRLSLPDGTRLNPFTLLRRLDKRAISHCSNCGGNWPVFETAASPGVRPSDFAIVRVVETSRVGKAIGQDVRRLDNSGPASAVFRIKATQRWTWRIEFDDDRTYSSSIGVDLFGFKASAENALIRHFSGGKETEQIFEEEIELAIPPHTALELVLAWKRIWQKGEVAGVNTAGVKIQSEFRAVVGLAFDHATRTLAPTAPRKRLPSVDR